MKRYGNRQVIVVRINNSLESSLKGLSHEIDLAVDYISSYFWT
jgi:hypothetical protein